MKVMNWNGKKRLRLMNKNKKVLAASAQADFDGSRRMRMRMTNLMHRAGASFFVPPVHTTSDNLIVLPVLGLHAWSARLPIEDGQARGRWLCTPT